MSGNLTNNEESVEKGINVNTELFMSSCEMIWVHDKEKGTLSLLINKIFCGTTKPSDWLKKGKFYIVASLLKPSKLKCINPSE